MTTSYELSIRLKESGVPQEGGEYYWVKSHGDEIYRVYGNTLKLNGADGSILCRAFTLGELVRMIPEISIVKLSGDKYGAVCVLLSIDKSTQYSTSPEEAAGELLCELKQKEG